MDACQTYDSMMDSFTLDDINSLVTHLTIGASQTISRTDLLVQLDRLRDVRKAKHSRGLDSFCAESSMSSPDFSFKLPSKVMLSEEVEPLMRKLSLKSTSASNEAEESGTTDQKTSQFNPPAINFAVGNAGQTKRHGRPRRGITPHKLSPGENGEIMPDFTSFFLQAKENLEPHSVIPKDSCSSPELVTAKTNIPLTSPEFAFSLTSEFNFANEKAVFSTPSGLPTNISHAVELSQSAIPDIFQPTKIVGKDKKTPQTAIRNNLDTLTPQSADSAMSLDDTNMDQNESEDAPGEEQGQLKESQNTFHPQSLKFDFNTSAVKANKDPTSEGNLFNIGQHTNARKKGEKRGSPGQKKRIDTSINAIGLDDYFASVTLDETSHRDKRETDSGFKVDPSTPSIDQSSSLFAPISGLDFQFGILGPGSKNSNVCDSDRSGRNPSTSSGAYGFNPLYSTRSSFTFQSSAIKTARPPSPKKSPSAAVYPAHIRRTKTPIKTSRISPKKPLRSANTSPSTNGMDVDTSPVPSAVNTPKGVPQSTRKETPGVPSSPVPSDFDHDNNYIACGTYGDERDTGDDSTENWDSDTDPSTHTTAKETFAPMSVLKPPKTNQRPGVQPDESAERMNDLANQYRKQGGDLYSREKYEMALDSFEKSLKFGSPSWANRSTVLGNRAATLMMLGRYVEAADDCATAILADPNMAKLHSRRGRALIRLGRFDGANEAFSLVLEASSSNFYDLDAAKTDARNGLKTLLSARSSMKRLSQLEATGDLRGVLNVLEELTAQCPSCAVVHTSRCNVLCKLLKWAEAKECAEGFICTAHITIQKMTAHMNAVLPAPAIENLIWSEVTSPDTKITSVKVNVSSIVEIALIMGPKLAQAYLTSLKNIETCPNCCSDVMLHIQVLLSELSQKLSVIHNSSSICSSSDPLWGWVEKELQCSKDSSHWKDLGDRQFRTACLGEAVVSYTNAINADPQSIKWSAILFNNRAAAHMGLGRLAETVADCHQAISRDPNYSRAYLRRARALGAMKSYAASIRDFRHFLSSSPPPLDAAQVTFELESMVETNRREIRGDQVKHAWETRGEEQRRPCATGVEGGAPKGTKPWGMPSSKSRYSTSAGGGAPKGPSVSKGKGNLGWDSDEEAFFNKAKQQHYQKCNKSSSNPKTVFGTKSTTWGRSRGGMPYGEDSNDEEGEVPIPHNPNIRPAGNENKSNPSSSSSSSVVRNGGVGCHYHTLGIDSASTERQVKVAYRKLALRYHPDKNKEEGAEDLFKSITSAYSVIIDKTTRDQYDRTRRGNYRAGW